MAMDYMSNSKLTGSLAQEDPGLWRPEDFSRPWYLKALSLISPTKKENIVDLGAGKGEFAEQLKKLKKQITCLEGSPIYVNLLKKKGFKAVQVDFNQKLALKSGQFDGAISLEVIEHLTQVDMFLKETNRILKPKGWFILSTPNIAWWGYRLSALMGKPPKKEGYHFRFFTHHSLNLYLSQAGFKVVKTASFSTIPLLNRLLISLNLKPLYPNIKLLPNLLAQDLVFLCRKK
jgi:2-polyprenyl-3-methyl-5-hydroxy-6-metoxy-1,4-benzoquinol methylase